MDFRGRSSQANQNNQSQATPTSQPAPVSGRPVTSGPTGTTVTQPKGAAGRPVNNLFRIGSISLLFAVTGLVVALTFLLALGSTIQQHAIQKAHYQAVFLNNGQVYFGHISTVGNKTVDLQNIYYLQTSGGANGDTQAAASTSATNVSLVKLGCELHAPYDRMLINSDQVIFWENLQDSSQVVQAIAKYKKDNAKTSCSQQSKNSTQQAPSTPAATPAPVTTAPTTPPVKKP